MDWRAALEQYGPWILAASAGMFVGSLILLPWLIIRMPADYFVRRESRSARLHPVLHFLVLAVRNVIGAMLLLVGIIMIFTPGQGILSILVGLSLLTFPGKRKLELKIIRRPAVLHAINKLRQKAGRPPLVVDGLPDDDADNEAKADAEGE